MSAQDETRPPQAALRTAGVLFKAYTLRTGEPAAAILCTGGADVIRKEAWPFYRTIFGVRLCWELEEPEGPTGLFQSLQRTRVVDSVGHGRAGDRINNQTIEVPRL